MAENNAIYEDAGRRIDYLTLSLSTAAALVVAIRWGWRAAAGLALGAGLSWVNYRWLKQGVGALAQLSIAQAGATKLRIPKRIYLKFLGRLILLLMVLYAILSGSLLPGATILAGLFAVVVAVLVEMIYRLVRGEQQPKAS